MTTATNTDRGELDSAREVLVFARESQAAANQAQADLMVAAVTWAEQHPPESIDEAATWITPGGDTGLTLAGEGAPLVAEFCIAEFALADRPLHRRRPGTGRGRSGAEVPPAPLLGPGADR